MTDEKRNVDVCLVKLKTKRKSSGEWFILDFKL